MSVDTPRASIAIPTFNGEEFLEDLLMAIRDQTAPFGFETIVVDSGSTDATLTILKRFPEVRLHQVPNREFAHGRTRNLLARLARGEFVVFLTQDAVPADEAWLAEMIHPFDEVGDELAAVFGKQIPRRDCCPIVKRDVMGFFATFGADDVITVHAARDGMTQQEQDAAGFLSNVNSAVRRSVLEEIPFPEVEYAEDQAFGRAVIAAGYRKAYAPRAAVLHSHNLGPRDYFERMVDEFTGLRSATGAKPKIGLRHVALGWGKPTIADARFIVADNDYSRLRKVAWLAQAPAYNFGRYAAMYLAASDNADDHRRRFSRERRLKGLGHRLSSRARRH